MARQMVSFEAPRDESAMAPLPLQHFVPAIEIGDGFSADVVFRVLWQSQQKKLRDKGVAYCDDSVGTPMSRLAIWFDGFRQAQSGDRVSAAQNPPVFQMKVELGGRIFGDGEEQFEEVLRANYTAPTWQNRALFAQVSGLLFTSWKFSFRVLPQADQPSDSIAQRVGLVFTMMLDRLPGPSSMDRASLPAGYPMLDYVTGRNTTLVAIP